MSHNAATRVNETATTADTKNLTTNDSESVLGTSSMDQFYSRLSTLLGNNLAQDLKNIDPVLSEDILAARLEEFTLRFGNANSNESDLRMMSIFYRHSRYLNPD